MLQAPGLHMRNKLITSSQQVDNKLITNQHQVHNKWTTNW